MNTHTIKSVFTQIFLTLFLVSALGACSSGGGGDNNGNTEGSPEPEPPPPPRISIHDLNLAEGDTVPTLATVEVTLDKAASEDVTLEFATSNGVALAGSDYNAQSGTLTIAAGNVASTIEIEIISDLEYEEDEQFVVNIFNVSPSVEIDNDEAFVTLLNDDLPALEVSPAYSNEPDTDTANAVFIFELQAAAESDITVDVATRDVSALAGNDFSGRDTTLTIPVGERTTSFEIEIYADDDVEQSEVFELLINNIQGPATLAQNVVQGFIYDSDTNRDGPQLFGLPANASEVSGADSFLVFKLFIDEAIDEDIEIQFNTSADTALSPQDFTAVSGVTNIVAGENSTEILVAVMDDDLIEDPETLTLSLSLSPASSTGRVNIITPSLIGTIADNDSATPAIPSMSITSASLTEGDSASQNLEFTVALSEPSSETITVDFASEEQTASAGSDFTAVSGSLVFLAGEQQKIITVEVLGDTFTEDDETFRIRLSNPSDNVELIQALATGTILTDEPFARLSIAGVSVLEGNTGNTNLVFTLTLDVATADAVSVDFYTADNTATAGEDYSAQSGSVSFLAGETMTTIAITAFGDFDNESDESFDLFLENLSPNASFIQTSARGTLINDDSLAGWQESISIGQSNAGSLPDLAMDDTGFGAVLWQGALDPLSFRYPINITPIVAGIAQTHSPIADSAGGSSWHPAIVAPGSNTLLGLWRDSNDDTWFQDSLGASTSFSLSPEGAWNINMASAYDAAGAGDAIALWENTSSPIERFFARFDSTAQTWDSPTTITLNTGEGTGLARIGMDTEGNAIVVWQAVFDDIAESALYYQYYDAESASWNDAAAIPGSNTYYSPAHISMFEGKAMVFTIKQSSAPLEADNMLRAFYFDPELETWSESQPNGTATEEAHHPISQTDAAGNIFVVWAQSQPANGSVYDTFANRYDAATGTWGTPQALENSENGVFASYMDIDTDVNGNAIAVWAQVGTNSTNIRAAHFLTSTGEWTAAEPVNDEVEGEYANYPKIALTEIGHAFVIWKVNNVEIRSKRYLRP